MDYQTVKTWFAEKENKQKCVYGVCFVLVFIVGFGAGSFDKELQKAKLKSQTNYTTKSAIKQTSPMPAAAGAGEPAVAQVKGAATAANCPVKGNINSKGGKIYHAPGGAFYNLVKPEQCFNTEADAQAAGFVKSSR